jgi:hypothetical protein
VSGASTKARKAPSGGSRTRRAELQLLLEAKGIEGYVLPRQEHGTIERPAQGWYVKLADDRVEFLGDYMMLAAARMDLFLPAPSNGRKRTRAK